MKSRFTQQQGLYSAITRALPIPESALSEKYVVWRRKINQLEYDKWYCSAYVGLNR